MNSQEKLNKAIINGDSKLFKELLPNVDINTFFEGGFTPLMLATEFENDEIILLLLSHGAEINKENEHGETALHLAVDIAIDGTHQTGGNPGDEPTSYIKILLDHGADINHKNKKGETPLDWAYAYQSNKIINFLKQYAKK
jgi:ankyrin repeat protein